MSPTHQDLSNDTTFSQIKSRVPIPLRSAFAMVAHAGQAYAFGGILSPSSTPGRFQTYPSAPEALLKGL